MLEGQGQGLGCLDLEIWVYKPAIASNFTARLHVHKAIPSIASGDLVPLSGVQHQFGSHAAQP